MSDYSTDTHTFNIVLRDIQHDTEYYKVGPFNYRYNSCYQLSELVGREIKCLAQVHNMQPGDTYYSNAGV